MLCNGRTTARFHNCAGSGHAWKHLRMNVLDLDDRFVNENADSQSEASERHDIDALTSRP